MIIKIQKHAFTLIELIITIVILGIILIPLGIMAMEFTKEIVYARDLEVAQNLAKTEMAKVNNLSFTDATLADGYDNTATSYEGYPYGLRRNVNFANPPANTLKRVQVRVYPPGNTTEHLVNLVTYVASVSFGAGSGGGAAGSSAANFLVVSGGSISGKDLQNITMQNSDPLNPITITGVTISFSGASGIKLQKITFEDSGHWSGNADSGETVTLNTSFTLAAGTTYTNTGLFEFNKNLTAVTSLVFICSDGSESISYSW